LLYTPLTMQQDLQNIKIKVGSYIQERVLKGASKKEITDNTALISGGVMDSISTMQLVSFLEKEFGFEFQAHEVDRDNLDTIELISNFVLSKLRG
jgi:acyl carrier protein